MRKKPCPKPDWKRFEELVGRLEGMLGGASIKVRINDQIRDNSGELRQIDASVRVTTGTVDFLYIIECRNRKKVDDVTWVEQVATKRKRVGVHKAILVSNKPLTHNAEKAARELGIDVRTLEQIDQSIFPDAPRFETGTVRWLDAKLRILPQYGVLSPEQRAEVSDLLQGDRSQVRFSIPGQAEPQSLDELTEAAYASLKQVGFPPDSRGGTVIVEMSPPEAPAMLCVGVRKYPLRSLSFSIPGVVEIAAPLREFFGRYHEAEGRIDHLVSEHTTVEEGSEMTFTTTSRRDRPGIVVNLPPNFGDEHVRAQADPERGTTIEVYFDENDQPQIRRLP